MKPQERVSRKRWHVSLATMIAIALILFVFIYLLASSGPDYYRDCTSPNHISKFRGVGVGVNKTFSRIIEKAHDDFPVDVSPDAFNISLLFKEGTFSNITTPKTTNLLWAWLQFVINDMVLTSPSLNISDTLFSGTGITPIIRTNYSLDHGGNRQQINHETPYIDGSHIYGRDMATATALRRMDGTGKLKTADAPGQTPDDTSMLPYNATVGKFIGVDDRINQNPLLAALHVLFVREHNNWCDRLKGEMDYLTENELYNTARHLVIGEIQSITYTEVLPLLLGLSDIDPGVCFSSRTSATEDRTSVTNEFAAAASRTIHSMVTDTLDVRNPETGDKLVTSPISIFEPAAPYLWANGLGVVLLGASRQRSANRDLSIAESIRLLVGPQDISRDRDHQLPTYQQFYAHFTKQSTVHCSKYAYDTSFCSHVAQLYGLPDSAIDLYLGLLAERRSGSSLLGTVGSKLFKYQFSHVKHNDHYFYLWDRVIKPHFFEVHSIRLSKVILRNTDIADNVLRNNIEASVFVL